MKQEDKDILLKDLCARLPYGVIMHTPIGNGHLNSINQTIFEIELGINVKPTKRDKFAISQCCPYLRPMSSMTENEHKEYYQSVVLLNTIERYDWLNAHHFDYRGLIEKGLALKAPKKMY